MTAKKLKPWDESAEHWTSQTPPKPPKQKKQKLAPFKAWMIDGYYGRHLSMNQHNADSIPITVIPDGCDPTPAALKRLAKAALALSDEDSRFRNVKHAELLDAAAAYRKSTAKRGKKK